MQAAAARTAAVQAQQALAQANKLREAAAKTAQNAADKSVAAKAAAAADPKKKGVATRAENRAAATQVAAQQAQQAAADAQRKYDAAAQAQVQAEQKAGAARQAEQEARQAAASLGGKAASRSTVFSMGQKQRQELINYWEQRLKRSKNPDRQKQYQDYINRIKKGERPDPRQSEMEMEYLYRMMGGSSQRGFKNGREAKWEVNEKGEPKPETGSTRPDITLSSAMVEIKNYKIQNAGAMIKELKRQIDMRSEHGSPNIKQQAIIIDLRGQKASLEQINKLVERIAKETGVPKENIQVLTW